MKLKLPLSFNLAILLYPGEIRIFKKSHKKLCLTNNSISRNNLNVYQQKTDLKNYDIFIQYNSI